MFNKQVKTWRATKIKTRENYMKNVLVAIMVVLLMAGAAFAQETQPNSDLITVEGKIVLEKSVDGKDIAKVKSGLIDMVLVDNDVLQALLKVEKVFEKAFILEGKKVLAADGVTETFVISSFEEDAHDHDHDDHGHSH